MNFGHVGIVPAVLEESLLFFEKLGLKIVKIQREADRYVNELLGTDNLEVKTYKLGTDNKICLELLEFAGSELEWNIKNVTSIGITHFALEVDNLDELYKELKKDVEFMSPPLLTPDRCAKVVYCKDPDGNFIELVERL